MVTVFEDRLNALSFFKVQKNGQKCSENAQKTHKKRRENRTEKTLMKRQKKRWIKRLEKTHVLLQLQGLMHFDLTGSG